MSGAPGSMRSSVAVGGVGGVVSPGQTKRERTCDSCFTKLLTAALDDASNNGDAKDRHAIRQMKEVTADLIRDLKHLLKGFNGQHKTAGQSWEEDYYCGGGDDMDHDSDSSSRYRDSLDENDRDTFATPSPSFHEPPQRGSSKSRHSATQRLSSAVMTIAGCGSPEDHANAGQHGPSSLKLSLVHNDTNFQRSIKENAHLLALATKIIEVEKTAMSFVDATKVFQSEVGVVVEHE